VGLAPLPADPLLLAFFGMAVSALLH